MSSYARQGNPSEVETATLDASGGWQAVRSLEDLLGVDMGVPRPGDARRSALLARALTQEVIPRLVLAHTPAASASHEKPIDCQTVTRFAALLLKEDDELIDAFVVDLRERGVGLEDLFMNLLGPSAAQLGLLWERDLCGFSEVTVALGRLQLLLRKLGMQLPPAVRREEPRRLLMLCDPHEQHTFGMHMVGEFFQREGWEVDIGLPEGVTLAQCVANTDYQVVGLTAATERGLAGLPQIIATVRSQSRNERVSIILGGPMFSACPERGKGMDVDAIITDGASAPAHAERLVDAQKRSP